MSKRKVTLKLTTQKDLINHESAARTFGELKSELGNVKWDGMRVVERTDKRTLQLDDAVLPSGDFVLFLVPEKVKSGASKAKKAVKKLKNIATAKYNELRSHASFLNNMKDAQIAMNGGTEELRKAVQTYYDGKDTAGSTAEGNDVVATIEEARTKINAAIDTLIANAGNAAAVDTTEYLIKTSVDDLDNEFNDIKKALKL